MSEIDQNKHNNLISLITTHTLSRKVAFLSGHVHTSNSVKDITASDDYLNFVVGKALKQAAVLELNDSEDKWNRWLV